MFGLHGRWQTLRRAARSSRRGVFALSVWLVACGLSMPAAAESLEQALADAYLLNPVLNAERARLRAIDEQVALAKSGLRPTITGSGSTAYNNQNSNLRGRANVLSSFGGGIGSSGVTHPHGYALTLSQLLFGGFQNLNAIREAKSLVQAQRETLRQVEQTVLLDAATAYVNVVRDQAVVRLRENDVQVLTEQLKATRDRFDVGEVTRTDVAQAEARRSEALATLASAQANLKISRATYEQVIGHPPGTLSAPPSIRHLLPNSLDEAMTLGDGENPVILTAVYNEESSLYAVERIMGELLPSVSLEAQYEKAFDQSSTISDIETTSVTGRLSVPLYQGGGVSARVRQAKETNNQLKREVENARLSVHADVISNWGILQSSGPAIRSAEAAVGANKIALTGVREEEKVGQRTTLDVLDAQRELLNSQIGLVSALRDRVVAEYSLYSAIGRMDAQTLGLSVPYYDPFEHYEIIKNKLWGLAPPEPPLADN
ncbi:TolC family outer membrane protein [Methyloceanibacter caenitepidi]|uniref:Type I secretion outer membrane protein, TolC n=1 Tax=Methyloceanibacter caenitepidi TaxID=1384459 RepID=A0A0A8K5J2_9HYPH|nr:TolC family outer membrane protein [Methyloceanibacter caenitepidi]BAQ17264.1 type I secretion outer membrane protein, TolC precursor [Methyloceanibacter caenitepidi]